VPGEKALLLTVGHFSPFVTGISLSGFFAAQSVFSDLLPSNDSFVAIRCSGNANTELLLSSGLFRHSILFFIVSVRY
jgi:hypothetical protein